MYHFCILELEEGVEVVVMDGLVDGKVCISKRVVRCSEGLRRAFFMDIEPLEVTLSSS